MSELFGGYPPQGTLEKTKEMLTERPLDPNIQELLGSREFVVSNFEKEIWNSERGEYETIPHTLIELKHSQKGLKELPQGYCYVGGVARNVLLRELGETVLPPRDIDIVGIDDFEPDTEHIDSLSRELMQDDYSHGHGVKTESKSHYFTSRDFSINEILVNGDTIIATPEALKALHDKVIEPTDYERDRWTNYQDNIEGVHPKLVLKALRLQVEFEEQFGRGEIKGIEDWQWNLEHLPLFFIQLSLEKAYQRGDALAIQYFSKLKEIGVVDPKGVTGIKGNNIKDLAVNVNYKMHESGRDPFEFNTMNIDHWLDVVGWNEGNDDELYNKFAEIAKSYQGSGFKHIKQHDL